MKIPDNDTGRGGFYQSKECGKGEEEEAFEEKREMEWDMRPSFSPDWKLRMRRECQHGVLTRGRLSSVYGKAEAWEASTQCPSGYCSHYVTNHSGGEVCLPRSCCGSSPTTVSPRVSGFLVL